MEIKGVMHVHSTYSYDGKESLRSLRDLLMQKGITFCCLTDHTNEMTISQAQLLVQECKALSGSQFVFIPGFEVPYKNAHILLIGTEIFLRQTADSEILRQWSSKSRLTILAHPVRNQFTLDRVMEEVIDGVEIWNRQYDGKKVPRTHSAHLLRALQEKNQSLLATGGLDFHRTEHLGSPYYTLEVEHLSSEAIVKALVDGSYVFGNEKITVASNGLWKGSGTFPQRFLSFASIAIIQSGKSVNALLAIFGLKFPKALRRFIRSKV